MKRYQLLLIIFLTLPFVKVFATEQAPDIIIYKGDTLSLFANPLEQLYKKGEARPDFFNGKKACWTTGCWRGYQATWTIEEDLLYLTEIRSCCFYEDSIKADLEKVFGSKYIGGKVKAEWYTATVIAPHGEIKFYGQMGYSSLYEKERELNFQDGRLISTRTYDNSKSRPSVYYGRTDKLNEFIYSNINWDKIPALGKKKIRVSAYFSANEYGIVDSAVIMTGNSRRYNREAIRVIKAIPAWDIVYEHGKLQRRLHGIGIVFSEANRLKYSRSKQN